MLKHRLLLIILILTILVPISSTAQTTSTNLSPSALTTLQRALDSLRSFISRLHSSSFPPANQLAAVGGDSTIPYGDVDNTGLIDSDDIICALNAFQGIYYNTCSFASVDIAPCGGGNGILDVDDITAVREAFAGNPKCAPQPLPCQNNLLPQAEAGPDQTVNINIPVNFNGSGSTDPDARAVGPALVTYTWDFGAGAEADGQNPSHAYATPGSYTVTLTVTDQCNGTASDTLTVQVNNPPVQNQPPTANAGPNQSAAVNTIVTLNGVKSKDLDGQVTAYWWNYGDGQSTGGYQSQAIITHAYTKPGAYTVTLWVRDDDGAQSPADTAVVTVTATPVLPPANAGPDRTVIEETPVTFTANAGLPPDPLLTYRWDFGDHGSCDLTPSLPGANLTHTYHTPGVYTVTLFVSNTVATSTDTAIITVATSTTLAADFKVYQLTEVREPNSLCPDGKVWEEIDLDDPNDPDDAFDTIEKGLRVKFEASSSSGNTRSLWLQYGDGDSTTAVIGPNGEPPQINELHTYTTTGLYSARLRVRNLQGQALFRTWIVHVAEGLAPVDQLDVSPAIANWGRGTVYARGLIWVVDGLRQLRGVQPLGPANDHLRLVVDTIVHLDGVIPDQPFDIAGSNKALVVATRYGFYVYDLRGIPNPPPLGMSQVPEPVYIAAVDVNHFGTYYGIAMDGDYLYLPRASYLEVFDLSNPGLPVRTDRVAALWLRSVPPSIVGDRAYAVFATTVDGQPYRWLGVFDISNRAHPELLQGQTTLENGVMDLQANGSLLVAAERSCDFAIDCPDGTLAFFDISDRDNPRLLSRYRHDPYAQYRRLLISGNIVYAAEISELTRIDITNPRDPYALTTVGNAYATGLVELDGLIYAGTNPSTLKAFRPIEGPQVASGKATP